MKTTTRKMLAVFALRAIIAAGLIGCGVEEQDTSSSTPPPASYPSCAEALHDPTDGNCQAYGRMMDEAGLVQAEDHSYVRPSYYEER